MERQDNTIYVASISYGKDSLAMLEAIRRLDLPLDRIITAQVWATQDIPADLPEMYEWKSKADKIILQRYGVKVEHLVARNKGGEKLAYEDIFYRQRKPRGGGVCRPYGFPIVKGNWCTSMLKKSALRISVHDKSVVQQQAENGGNNPFSISPAHEGRKNIVSYIGIAADEQKRIERHVEKSDVIMPLVRIGWTESDCRQWCSENGLLSPVYEKGTRDGCWFCHNQSIDQLRRLRNEYPELWSLLLKWDNDSPVSFHPDGRTVHDFDKRFHIEETCAAASGRWSWDFINQIQMSLFDK